LLHPFLGLLLSEQEECHAEHDLIARSSLAEDNEMWLGVVIVTI
jgi:hypothetical protein